MSILIKLHGMFFVRPIKEDGLVARRIVDWNNAGILGYTWAIVSGQVTSWVKWSCNMLPSVTAFGLWVCHPLVLGLGGSSLISGIKLGLLSSTYLLEMVHLPFSGMLTCILLVFSCIIHNDEWTWPFLSVPAPYFQPNPDASD